MVRMFSIVVVALWVTITILLHSIEGVNLVAWYLLATPLVVLRFIRAILLSK
jgi:hypothetical protein